jgi:dinuclear metal center YbgI/SA1388 family protein
VDRDRIVTFLNDRLGVGTIPDYGPQGLLVEGKADVRKVVVGVTASVELFRRAVDVGADMIICHHGMFWDFDSRVVKGGLKQRLSLLLANEITLLGYHLVLDAHEDHGNNALIAQRLGLASVEPFGDYKGHSIGRRGRFAKPLSHADFTNRLREVFGGDPLVFPFGPEPVTTVGIVSGGAVNDVSQAIDAGLDAYVTGEAKEFVQEYVREAGITYVAAGHYRTETFGVRSLGELLNREFGVEQSFNDVPTPV